MKLWEKIRDNLIVWSGVLCLLSIVVMYLIVGNIPFFPYILVAFPGIFLGITIGLLITRRWLSG